MTKRKKVSRSKDSASSRKRETMAKEIRKSRFNVGQVVCLSKLEYYANNPDRLQQLYQVITAVEPWSPKYLGFCLTFANGDKCHHRWVRPLSKKEVGR